MSQLQIKRAETGYEKKQFLSLPWTIYRDDPHWIPPLRMNQKELLNFKRHPFYDNAEIQTFLAIRNGQPCGRIAAIVNHVHNERHDEKRGFFGFFESIDDSEVATGLFDTACKWLADKGMTAVRGPMSPSFNYEIGLLIEGFNSPPTFMITYNKKYYEKLIEDYGFRKTQDLYTFWGHIDMLETLDKKLAFVAEEARRRFGFEMRPMNKRNFEEDVRTFLRVFNEANGNHWGISPLTDGEIKHIATGMKQLIAPKMTRMAEVDGRVVGTCLGMLDYNPRIKAIDGRLFPVGFLRLLWNKQPIKKLRFVATHVLPEYQKWGLGLVLLADMVQEILDWGITEVEFSWVAESNHLSRGTLERGGAIKTKTHRLYDYDLPQ